MGYLDSSGGRGAHGISLPARRLRGGRGFLQRTSPSYVPPLDPWPHSLLPLFREVVFQLVWIWEMEDL